jgi:hypothetical protein
MANIKYLEKINNLNYKYLGFAVIFFLITYYFLYITKKSIVQYDIDIKMKDKSSIKVLTSKGEIYMNSNIFEMHMNRVKETIHKLTKNITTKDCNSLKKYLDDANINIKNYITLNTNDTNALCANNNNIFNDSVIKERELLKKKLDKTLKRDDIDDDISDNIKYNILNLVIDIDIILFLIKGSVCKKGFIDLTSIDKVILELYRSKCTQTIEPFNDKINNCTPVCTLNTPTPCYDQNNYYFDPLVNSYLSIKPANINKCDKSIQSAETVDVSNTNMIKETFMKKPINNNMTTQSHNVEKDFKCNTVKLGKQLACSSYNTGFIDFYKDYELEKKSKGILDTKSMSSLVNDYNGITPCYSNTYD